jgi:ATP-dependent Clp protease protease subunit
MTLDASGEEPIDVYLDSPDGTLEAAFVLIDVLDLLHVTVRGHCHGQVGGPAIGVVAVADHRAASPHTTFRLVQPTAQFSGTPDQIAAQSQQQRELLWRFQARLANATGRPVEEIADDMRRGRYLDAQEALEYGLLDAIK